MRLSSLPHLVKWQLQMLVGPTAAAPSTASAPAGPSIMRLEICKVHAIESQDYTCEDVCFTLEFDMETMRAYMHLKRSCTRKTIPAVTSLMLISSMIDKLTFPRRHDESLYKQHVLNHLDSLEHYLEIERLKKLGVLRPHAELPQDCTLKHPSTSLVRPCRAKKQK